MARPLRIQYPDALYHVMNRGAGRSCIYQNEEQRLLFLSLLEEITLRYHIEIHAYCLMSNHYHLLLKTPFANLDRAMRHLNGVYTQRYNQLMNKDGSLFRGRYKACTIEADNYLVQVSRYIHLNPVKAKLCKNPQDYCWSSYRFFLGLDQSPYWLKLTDTLQYFGDTDHKNQYRDFVEADIGTEEHELIKKIKESPIIGTDNFIKYITENFFRKSHQVSEIPMHKKLPIIPSLQHIENGIRNYFNVTKEELLKSKPKITNLPKLITLYLAVKLTHEKSKNIGLAFGGISANAVTQAYHRTKQKILLDKQLKITINNIEKQIYSDIDR